MSTRAVTKASGSTKQTQVTYQRVLALPKSLRTRKRDREIIEGTFSRRNVLISVDEGKQYRGTG